LVDRHLLKKKSEYDVVHRENDLVTEHEQSRSVGANFDMMLEVQRRLNVTTTRRRQLVAILLDELVS
jgi:hypothetical protein